MTTTLIALTLTCFICFLAIRAAATGTSSTGRAGTARSSYARLFHRQPLRGQRAVSHPAKSGFRPVEDAR